MELTNISQFDAYLLCFFMTGNRMFIFVCQAVWNEFRDKLRIVYFPIFGYFISAIIHRFTALVKPHC